MRTDAPAALPLLALAIGLACSTRVADPGGCTIAFAAAGLLTALAPRLRSAAVPAFSFALGLAFGSAVAERAARELSTFAAFDGDRFVSIEAEIEHDWARRGESCVLRVSRFDAGGHAFDAPLAIYLSSDPPTIAMEKSVVAEGFLRLDQRGQYTLSVKSSRLLSYRGTLPWSSPAAWNRAIANRLRPHAASHPTEVALVEALVLGRGERITDDVRESFKRGGTYHLLVFSGMQIAFAAALLALALRWAGAPRMSDWLLLVFACVAPPFIGAAASVSRASIGIGLYSAARILKRPTSIENLFCVAALCRLMIEPRDLTDPSFHLTYAGAGALLFVGKAFHSRWVAHAAAAEIAITPLTLFHFHQYALGGSLLTLAMSPIIFLALGVSAVACAFPTSAVFTIVGLLHRLCVSMNGVVSPASGFFTAPPAWALASGFLAAGVAIATLRGRRRGAAITVALLVPSLAAVVQFARLRSVDTPRAIFFDVGQGDSIAFRWQTHAILVDGGGRRGEWRFGQAQLLPMLLDRGIGAIDVVVATHAHPDHCAGLLGVISQMRVGEVWISPRLFRGDCAARLLDVMHERRVPVVLLKAETRRAYTGVRIRAIPPERTFRQASENNASLALVIEAEGKRILLPGDAQAEEEIVLRDYDIDADVLKVGHHGSRSSTSTRFLDAVSPRVAVISCGRRNVFGNPHRDVLEELRARRIRTYRTDRNGTVELQLSRGHAFVTSEIDTPPQALVQ